MSAPRPFHLPGLALFQANRCIDGSTLRVPELDATQVQRVNAALRRASQTLRGMALGKRVQLVADAFAELRLRGCGRWSDVLCASTGLSPAGLIAAWEATFAPHTVDALHAALRTESLDDETTAPPGMRAPRQILHVVAGNVPAPTVHMLLRGWLLGAAQWLRPSAREPWFAVSMMSELQDIAPHLAKSCAVLWWPHRSRSGVEVLRSCETVTLQGDDASVSAMREHVEEVQPHATFVGYGSRWSAALLSRDALTPASAVALAQDVALFDQQGCLSPTIAFVERSSQLESWCDQLAARFAALEQRMPRGTLPPVPRAALRHWHQATRLKHVLGSIDGFWDDSIRWGIALAPECGLVESPLDRHLVVVPFENEMDLIAQLTDRLPTLQGIAVALDGWDAARRGAALECFNATRAAPIGSLQLAPPMWRQDHKPPFGSLMVGDAVQP